MSYTEEQIKKMEQLGMLGYSVEKCINVCDIKDEVSFRKDFANPNSIIKKSYDRGVDKAEFAIDIKLFDKARSGDLSALKKYEERKAWRG